MTKHIVAIISICALIVICMFLPFVPGRYDMLAVTLSFMAQLLSLASLLLVPIGLIWLWYEIVKRKPGSAPGRKTKPFSIVTLLTLGVVLIIVSLGALTNYNAAFGIFFLVFCFLWLTRMYLKLRKQTSQDTSKFNPAPTYLITIPILIAAIRFTLFTTGVEFSRNYAIKKSEPLINAIESHYAINGSYPASLQALHPDILPGIIGIEQYHYEPNGNAYNLYFKQFSDELDVDEIVMYNKLDQHAFAAHALDILEYSGQQLALRRGDRRKYNLPAPHWIYIKFD